MVIEFDYIRRHASAAIHVMQDYPRCVFDIRARGSLVCEQCSRCTVPLAGDEHNGVVHPPLLQYVFLFGCFVLERDPVALADERCVLVCTLLQQCLTAVRAVGISLDVLCQRLGRTYALCVTQRQRIHLLPGIRYIFCFGVLVDEQFVCCQVVLLLCLLVCQCITPAHRFLHILAVGVLLDKELV